MTSGEAYIGIINFPNVGQVANLPYYAVVETLGTLNALGATAIAFSDVSLGVQSVLQQHMSNQELNVQAALTGDRSLALQVFLNDPLSGRLTIAQARQLPAEMLEVNKQYLPKFFNRQTENII